MASENVHLSHATPRSTLVRLSLEPSPLPTSCQTRSVREGSFAGELADEDLQFKALARSISVQVQKVSANTAAIAKFVDLLGGGKDNPTLRNRL